MRGSSRGSRCVQRAQRQAVPRRSRPVQLADLSTPLLSGRALFLAKMSVGDARVYTCTCTVHDKLSCTRLQNYTIDASLTDKSLSVSVSALWNLSYTESVVVCSVTIGRCRPGLCFNGGRCVPSNPQLCSCPEGFQGPRCQYGPYSSLISLSSVALLRYVAYTCTTNYSKLFVETLHGHFYCEAEQSNIELSVGSVVQTTCVHCTLSC